MLPLFSSLLLLIFGRFVGHYGASFISVVTMTFCLFVALFIFFEVTVYSVTCVCHLPFLWVFSELLTVEWCFIFDSLSATMLVGVYTISTLVHLYSTEYMSDDPHLTRFLAYLSFFTFFMAILLTSGNFLQLFLGWEGVGLASYLLINFWFMRSQANKSALKAMLVNRAGDWGLSFGIFLIFVFFGTLDYYSVFAIVTSTANDNDLWYFFVFDYFRVLDLISFFLLLGVIGKSAQFGLHTWLPDAMEGPTPVSALLHAATMVTAGLFLLLRCSFIFEHTQHVLYLVSFVGALTAFFAATVACEQDDMKKLIAYSTCSQLGYMVAGCGLSLYSASLFHFFNHAFFKALLFLGAGSLIHAVLGDQESESLTAVDELMPVTSQAINIGSLALSGLPFLSGFYSKDCIVSGLFGLYYVNTFFVFLLLGITLFLTSGYSSSLIEDLEEDEDDIEHESAVTFFITEPGLPMLLPLIILSFYSIFIGFICKDLFFGFGEFVFSNSLYVYKFNSYHLEFEFLPVVYKLAPWLSSVILAYHSDDDDEALEESFIASNSLILDRLVNYNFQFFNLLVDTSSKSLDDNYSVFIVNNQKVNTSILNNFSGKFISFKSLRLTVFRQFQEFSFFTWFYDALLNWSVFKVTFKFAKEVTFKLIDKSLFEHIGPYALIASVPYWVSFWQKFASGYIYHYIYIFVFMSLLLLAGGFAVNYISLDLLVFLMCLPFMALILHD